MSISYNYFLPSNIYGTLQVVDLGFPGFTAVNANIYCQRNINCDGQLQCEQFHSLGTAYFDQVPTCVIDATTATQLTNYQTVQGLISASGGITAQQAIDAVHTSSQQFTVPQNIWNTLTFRTAGGSASSTLLQHADSIGYFIFTNTTSTGSYRFNLNTAGVQSSVLEMNSTLFKVRAGTAELNLTTVNALTCSNNATFNGAFPTTTLGSNTGVNNNEFATVGYAKSIGGTSILALNNTFTGTNTFQIPIISSGASITVNTIPAASIVNNSITDSQIASGFQLVSTGSQTFSGNKIFNGTAVTNEMIINIPSAVSSYFGSIGFIPACTANYLNLTTELFDSMMFIGQPIANGIDRPYGFTIGDYNSGGTGIRISGTGASGNCSVSLNGSVFTTGLLTCNNGLFINLGNIDNPNNSILGNVFCDIFNNYDQLTGTDITLNPNNFVQCVVNDGNNSVLPSSGINYGGLKIGWNCSNSIGETDFVNLANFANTGGFNWYTMNASSLPSLIGSLTPTALTIPGSLTNNSIVNSSATLPYHIQCGTRALPTTTTGDLRNGFLIGWNGLSGSNGETDFTNLNQGGNQGGFLFGNIPVGGSYQRLASLLPLNAGGLRLWPYCGNLRVDDNTGGIFSANMRQDGALSIISSAGINTSLFLQCGNASAVATNVMSMNTGAVQPLVNFNPQSTTTFNSSHPTTTLALPTLSNQYATVGYVSSVVSPNILPLNNTFTGTNLFRNTTGGITTSLTATLINNYFGCGAGGAGNLVMGGNSLGTVNALNTLNIAICPTPNACLQNNIGNNNIAIGNASGNAQTSANRNIYIGTQCGTAVTGGNNICIGGSAGVGITSGTNNIAIGDSAWAGVNTFSNCTVIGAGALAPDASNQIVLGRTTDTVLIRGASQINDTLMTGTTVVSNNMQVNGNIILPIGTLYTAGVNTAFTAIPAYILFTPAAGMSFTLPVPNGTNAGREFVIRKIGAGGGQTINFSCTGNPAVWVNLNSGTGATSLNISTIWQFRFLCANNLYYQIA